jgi:hypothetical protein
VTGTFVCDGCGAAVPTVTEDPPAAIDAPGVEPGVGVNVESARVGAVAPGARPLIVHCVQPVEPIAVPYAAALPLEKLESAMMFVGGASGVGVAFG